MLPKKIINNRINEHVAKEYLTKTFNRYGVSEINLEKTPLGIKVVLKTPKPGSLISRSGSLLKEASTTLGKLFKQEPPHIDIEETIDPMLDPEVIADSIAFKIAKYGPMKYKTVAHEALDRMMQAGAIGAEVEVGGVIKERAAHFKFRPHGGVLPKTGQLEQYGVKKTRKQLLLKRGMIGIKVTIVVPKEMPGEVKFKDGGESKRPGNGASENEHKEDTGSSAS